MTWTVLGNSSSLRDGKRRRTTRVSCGTQIQGQKIVKDGKVLDTEEENLAGLAERAKLFAEKTAPVLAKLGIN